MNDKNNDTNKEKYNKRVKKRTKDRVVFRTIKQRRNEIKNIILELNKFQLNTSYEPIKKLYILFKLYIENGERIKVNIPFPMINKRIKGILATSIKEEVWLRLENEKF